MFYNKNLDCLLCLHANPIFGKTVWGMGQNALSQSDWKIFNKSPISAEEINEIAWLFAFQCKFVEIKNWSKNFGWARSKMYVASLVIGFKNWLSQEWTERINCFFTCWYKFRKARSCFNDFWVGMVNNGHGLKFRKALNSAVS